MFSRPMHNKNICHSQSTFGAVDRLSSAKRNRWMHKAQHSAPFILLPLWQATKFLSACDQVIANCCHPVAVSKWIWTGHHEMAAVVDDLTEEQLACSCTWISNPPGPSCLASVNFNKCWFLFLRPKFSLVNPNCGCHKIAYDNSGEIGHGSTSLSWWSVLVLVNECFPCQTRSVLCEAVYMRVSKCVQLCASVAAECNCGVKCPGWRLPLVLQLS